ncbi:uncharacterized protein LOC132639556 [Lycium barbarum]|uniref:uncharacterized protein LOC132639556 n=1 Tax=Lycium barbarum TaxID=112863 RepID=UPI00293EA7C9|nr:uncharacterized protein LOC132639556 [Lycium barbarum]
MHNRHKFFLVGLMEPFQQSYKLESYRRRLGIDTALCNVSGKIWAFVNEDYQVTVMIDSVQQLTLKLHNVNSEEKLIVTLLYTKCDRMERIELWESLYYLASDMTLPWLVGGDFNVICDEEEKYGGLPVSLNEVEDFRHCINTCNLTDLGYKGSVFTWWNGRGFEDCVFKRLDRCLGNIEFQQLFPGLQITHLIKQGSDHSPLFIECKDQVPKVRKSFKFLKIWAKHETFMDIVKENWITEVEGNAFMKFNSKLKNMRKALSQWSRATFGDIFQRISNLEEVIKVHKGLFEENPTLQNRAKLRQVEAELTRVYALEEEYWKQKAGQWLDDENDIAQEALRFFQDQFHQQPENRDPARFDILHHVPSMITREQNEDLVASPTKEEVKLAVFGLSSTSAGGPDVFTGLIYQTCWNVVGDDLFNMVWDFLRGVDLPRYITHTHLVLLPKKKDVQTFGNMRPISLSNFVNKVISRVIHERMMHLLPDLISQNQAGFVRGRSIVENILLTQEIITDIRLRTNKGKKNGNAVVPNVVMKLDMTKAYDRLSWLFLTKVLRKMGFCERFIGLIHELIVLSRGLNAVHDNLWYTGFGFPKWSPKINHLAYADDTIIFTSSCEISLTLIMDVLTQYENASGQLINKAKSSVYLHDKVDEETAMPIHLLSAMDAPSFVINKLNKIFAQLFWSNSIGEVNIHWAKWHKVCMPKEEGGLSFRRLEDMSMALFSKHWWNFRTRPSLWSSFMSNKYLKKNNPILVPWKRGSHVWRKMLRARDAIDHLIWWQLTMGSFLFWFDNWSGLGPLYFLTPPDFYCDENINNIDDVVIDGRWNENILRNCLPEELAEHILHEVHPPSNPDELDKPWLTLEARVEFSVKSAWEYLRSRGHPRDAYKKIWVKGLPFKVALLMWRVCHFKIPLDDMIRSWGYHMPSKCFCCAEPKEESVPYIFLKCQTAQRAWSYFSAAAGINIAELNLHQVITKWWTTDTLARLKPIFYAIPSIIMWELWKKRNGDKHGNKVSTSRVIYQASSNIQRLVKLRKPGIRSVPHRWLEMLKILENFVPKLQITKVLWTLPAAGIWKCNTDGATKGNPDRSAYAFCVRNSDGDLVYARDKDIEETTNTVSETMALLGAARFCLEKHVTLLYS